MANLVDLTGKRFGRLVVIRRHGKDKFRNATWECACDCGNHTFVSAVNLKNGNTKSCGCYGLERKSEANQTHGKTGSRLYRIWKAMHTRCYNGNSHAFKYYGGRGITICEDWEKDFQSFHDWALANGYRDDLTIDRVDNNRNYCPENCRWATMEEQNKNKRAENGKRIQEE